MEGKLELDMFCCWRSECKVLEVMSASRLRSFLNLVQVLEDKVLLIAYYKITVHGRRLFLYIFIMHALQTRLTVIIG